MRPAEFRSNPTYVSTLRAILADPVMQLWLDALETENPANKVAPADVTPHGAYILLGEQTGWNQFKQRFMLGAVGEETVRDDPGEQSYLTPDDKKEEVET